MTFLAFGLVQVGRLFRNSKIIYLILTRMLSHTEMRNKSNKAWQSTYLPLVNPPFLGHTVFLYLSRSLFRICSITCRMADGCSCHFNLSPVAILRTVSSLPGADSLYKGNLTVPHSVLHPLYKPHGNDIWHFWNRKQGLTVTGLSYPLGHLIGC